MGNFIKRYFKLIIVAAFVATGVVAILVYSSVRKSRPAPKEPDVEEVKITPVTSIEGITPGISDVSSLNIFGEPLSIEEKGGYTVYLFGPERSSRPTEVYIKEGKVVFVKKRPTANDKLFLSDYREELGEPAFTLYSTINEFRAYVFFEKGLVVIAHQGERGDVYELRYFLPTTKEDFSETWGKDLSSKPPPQLSY